MKTSNNKHKTFVLGKKGAAVLIITAILALVLTGCKQPAGGKSDGGSSGGGPTPPPSYTKVAYEDLDTYLKYAEAEVNYIEVTGTIPKNKFAGKNTSPHEPSDFGKILKKYPTKKIALKIENYPADLTNMGYCFYECENLVSLANLPTGVVHIDRCFVRCKNLISVADIPESVTDMCVCFYECPKLTGVKLKCDYNSTSYPPLKAFSAAFYGCMALTAGSIKVPAAFYDNYIAPDALTEMKVPGGNDEEKKAKFAAY